MATPPNDKVQLQKIESAAGGGDAADAVAEGPALLNPNEDMPEVRGLYMQDASGNDKTTAIWRDATGIRMKDAFRDVAIQDFALQTSLSAHTGGTANNHAISHITGLQTALNAKADWTGGSFTGAVGFGSFLATTVASVAAQTPIHMGFIGIRGRTQIIDSIATLTGEGDHFYCADRNPDFTITSNIGSAIGNMFDNDMASSSAIPVSSISVATPWVLEIKKSIVITATDVLNLLFIGHRLGSSGVSFTDWQVETINSDDTYSVVLNRTGVSDAIDVLAVPLHITGATYAATDTSPNYHNIKGVRITVRGATSASFDINNVRIAAIQLRDFRPSMTPADALGAMDKRGGDVFGDTNWRNGTPKVAGSAVMTVGGGTFTGAVTFSNNTTFNTGPVLNGVTQTIRAPGGSSGWARGVQWTDTAGTTNYGSIGMYGAGATPNYLYIGYGVSPWTSNAAIIVYPDEDVHTPNTLWIGGGDSLLKDVNLYRSAANVLKTDDAFVTGGSSSITAGGNMQASGGTLFLGADVNLYRSAADVLKTDDSMVIAGTLNVTGAITGTLSGTSSFANALNGNDGATGTGPYQRQSNDPPRTTRELRLDFKQASSVGVTDAVYGGLLTVSPYTDDSGGPKHQIYFGTSGNLYARKGTIAAGWEATWNRIWTERNNGHNNGIDADMVDGKHSTDFAPSSHVGSGAGAHSLAVYNGAHGFMSGTDKKKYDDHVGITAGNPHGTTASDVGAAPSSHVGSGGGAHATAVAGGNAGFMSGTDKQNHDWLWTNHGNKTYLTTAPVTSVAGKTGAVTLVKADVGLSNVEDKSSATIRGELTSSNVTTALGFTPYNSTNPAGFVTALTAPVRSVDGQTGVVNLSSNYAPYNHVNGINYDHKELDFHMGSTEDRFRSTHPHLRMDMGGANSTVWGLGNWMATEGSLKDSEYNDYYGPNSFVTEYSAAMSSTVMDGFPVGGAGAIVTINPDGGWRHQLGFPTDKETFYWRYGDGSGSAWKPWRELLHTGNFNPADYVKISDHAAMHPTATTGTAGYMSALDKQNLDALVAGSGASTANQIKAHYRYSAATAAPSTFVESLSYGSHSNSFEGLPSDSLSGTYGTYAGIITMNFFQGTTYPGHQLSFLRDGLRWRKQNYGVDTWESSWKRLLMDSDFPASGGNNGTAATPARSDHFHADATTAASGMMSASDKQKLNGIATGATNTALSNTTPQPVGTVSSAGVLTSVSRADHVHALPVAIPILTWLPDSPTSRSLVTTSQTPMPTGNSVFVVDLTNASESRIVVSLAANGSTNTYTRCEYSTDNGANWTGATGGVLCSVSHNATGIAKFTGSWTTIPSNAQKEVLIRIVAGVIVTGTTATHAAVVVQVR